MKAPGLIADEHITRVKGTFMTGPSWGKDNRVPQMRQTVADALHAVVRLPRDQGAITRCRRIRNRSVGVCAWLHAPGDTVRNRGGTCNDRSQRAARSTTFYEG